MSGPLRLRSELDTWQEIAAYLGVSVREAQYWEKQVGMPVHRMPGKKPRVRAHPAELDAWRTRVSLAGSGSSVVSANEATPAGAANGREAGGNADSPTQRLSRRALLGSVAGAGALSVAGAAWIFRRRAAVPVRAGVVGNTLCAWDEAGRQIWTYRFPEALRDQSADPELLRLPGRRVQMADLRGDGARQIVCAVGFSQGVGQPDREEVYCLASAGELLWRYKPGLAFTFGDTRFSGPWGFRDMLIVSSARQKVVWLAVAYWNWMPGAVVALDPEGRATVKFISAGNVYALAIASNHGRNCILAGGVNNEYACAALAALDEDAAPACSPQARGSRFECVDGPKGQPARYFLFPPSDVTTASDRPYNMVVRIDNVNDDLLVRTREIPGDENINAIYRLSRGLEPIDVAFDDNWAAHHRRLQQEGKLNHSLADCPHLNRPTLVRRWEPKSGWTTLSVPPNKGVKPDAYSG